MADAYVIDDFGFPLRTAERLHVMQGGRLTEGDHSLPADLPGRRGNDMHTPNDLGFTRQEYFDAQFELYCFHLNRNLPTDQVLQSMRQGALDASLRQMAAEHGAGMVGDTPIETPAVLREEQQE